MQHSETLLFSSGPENVWAFKDKVHNGAESEDD